MAAGIVKELDSSNRSYYKVDDIVKLLDVSQSKAYNMIREMRQECIDNGKSSYRGLGSIDFQAAARSVLIVGRIKEEPETRVVCHTKSSLAPEGKSIAFRLDKDNGFEWIGEYDISADELLNGDGKGQKSRKAKEFLLEILADGGMSQKKILEEAAKRGIKGKTLRNAKSELEVDSIKRGNQWYWVLPE